MSYLSYILITSILSHFGAATTHAASAPSLSNQDMTQTTSRSSFYQSSPSQKPIEGVALQIYREPSEKSTLSSTLQPHDDYQVSQGDWVKISDKDGKILGWAKAKDVQANIDASYKNAYQIIIDGPSEHYKVSKISPEVRKEQYASRQKRIQEHFRFSTRQTEPKRHRCPAIRRSIDGEHLSPYPNMLIEVG